MPTRPTPAEPKPDQPTAPVLLDTHVWVWWLNGDDRLAGSARSALAELSHWRGGLYVAAISLWEIGMLCAKGRLELLPDLPQWVHDALNYVVVIPLTAPIALASAQLPDFYGDPADRMIVATAQHHHLRLATHDTRLLQWASQHSLATLAV